MKAKNKLLRAALVLGLVLISAAALFPILYPLVSSFRTDQEIYRYNTVFQLHTLWPERWTAEAYGALFREYHFERFFFNTFLAVGVILPVSVILCSVAAYAFAFYHFRGKKPLYALLLLTFMVPGEAIALPLYQLVSGMGLVNTYGALILPSLANGLTLFMYRQAFKDVPLSLLEASDLDGAGWFTCYWQVVMPLCVPTTIAMCLMTFVNEWNNYLWPLLAARKDAVKTITVAITAFKEENVVHWNLIYSSSMISAVIPVLIFLPFQKYFVSGIASGSVKG